MKFTYLTGAENLPLDSDFERTWGAALAIGLLSAHSSPARLGSSQAGYDWQAGGSLTPATSSAAK